MMFQTAIGLMLVALAACSLQSETPEQRQRARQVAEDYDKQSKAEAAENKQKADEA